MSGASDSNSSTVSKIPLQHALTQTLFYRPAKVMSYDIQNNYAVYFEAGDYIQGLSLLSSVTNAGTSTSTPKHAHLALIPPPQHLAFLATLVVHPTTTTRALSPERSNASNIALQTLATINKVVGAINTHTSTAFAFSKGNSARRGGGKRRGVTARSDSSEDDPNERVIVSKLATEESIFANAEDFWHIVGWAFNCSIIWPKRWERWKMWIEYMLDVMEADWNERFSENKKSKPEKDKSLEQSLAALYLREGQHRHFQKRIFRAILADGDAKFLNEFGEVFHNETKERKVKQTKKPTPSKGVNFEEGNLGDYGNEDDDDDLMEDVPSARETKSPSSELQSPGIAAYGGIESILLRQRILAFLSKISLDTPHFLDTQRDFFDLYSEYLRSLPLSRFTALLQTSLLPPSSQLLLNAITMRPLLPTSPPEYSSGSALHQADFERHFLPHAANSHNTSDNAKLALLLENTLLTLLKQGSLKTTEKLGEVTLYGILKRRTRAWTDARRKRGDDEAVRVMADCHVRVMGLLVGLGLG
ncbi:hypothetical protein M501DRAFT_1002552 [Patellaria atrata CBS 101060]|uniref:Uncharacterized protein n=1 Tax=Patellaria atrata CBS 101060 TaxID=1346257 RepID=A0A9P4VQU3_9PEZI|nr:hypothetical protein M501DRAFT_1002552 [Patellaria atrata CBS 101060]